MFTCVRDLLEHIEERSRIDLEKIRVKDNIKMQAGRLTFITNTSLTRLITLRLQLINAWRELQLLEAASKEITKLENAVSDVLAANPIFLMDEDRLPFEKTKAKFLQKNRTFTIQKKLADQKARDAEQSYDDFKNNLLDIEVFHKRGYSAKASTTISRPKTPTSALVFSPEPVSDKLPERISELTKILGRSRHSTTTLSIEDLGSGVSAH